MAIRALEKPVGSLKILVYLFRNEKSTITTLLRDNNLNQRTTYAAIEKLADHELVDIEVSQGFPLRKYYKLTDRGKTVATHLAKVDRILRK